MTLTFYAEQLLTLLEEVVPDLSFCAVGSRRDNNTLYICVRGQFADEQPTGGYALAYCPNTNDILEDGVMLVRFFRKLRLQTISVH